MTTLPQTTMRLPRPSSNQITIPGSGAPIAAFAPGATGVHQAMTGADAWRVVRSHMWLIVLMLVVSSVGGYFLNGWLAKYHPRYTASAIVEITAPPSLDPLHHDAGPDLNSLSIEQKTQAQLLKTPKLFSEVLQDPNNPLHQTDWYRQQADRGSLAKDLQDNFIVAPQLDTSLIHLDMTAASGDDASKIIQSLVDRRMIDQDQLNKDAQQSRSVQLTRLKSEYENQSEEKTGEMKDKEQALNISGQGSQKLAILDQQMSNLQQMRLTAQQTLAKSTAILADLQGDLQKAQDQKGPDPTAVTEIVNRDPDVLRYKDIKERIDSELLTMSPNVGEESDVRKKLVTNQQMFAQLLAKQYENARHAASDQLLHAAQRDKDVAQANMTAIDVQIANLDADITKKNKDFGQYLADRNDLAGIQTLQKPVEDQLNQIANFTNQRNLTNLTWASYPVAQELATFPRLSVTLVSSIALGLALALGIAFARELLDTSVRSPRDITRIGHMNLLGMIPHEDDDPQSQGARLPLVIFEAPQSMMAEQLRQVRTRLQHAASLDTTRSILVTSPSPGDGKSMIAANLASGLALNGRRILLVDANFRRPSVHRMFNLANEHGFGDVLNAIDTFETTIQETQVPNLFVLPSGVRPSNATELLESQLLTDFIERALEEFDHVIFDSGPLLFVSETVALAPRVDGVVSVVRARTNSRGVLQRMRDSLRQVKAEHLGVVLNAVRSQGGGYYRRNIRTYYDYQNGQAA